MRKYFLLAIMAVSLCGFKRATNDVDTKVVNAASDKFHSFLANIPVGSEGQFGMASRDDIKAATLGTPYRVLILSKDFYTAQNVQVPFAKTFITESNAWRVPVVVDGTSRVLVTVDLMNDVYAAGDMGGAGIAKELQQLNKHISGHTYSLLKVYQVSADFLVDMPDNSLTNATFIPLSSARIVLPSLGDKGSYTLTETLAAIKEKLTK